MISILKNTSPKSEIELLDRCRDIEGLSFAQLSIQQNIRLPADPKKTKGWLGSVLETALGADAGNQALPDFLHLGIELKTLPIANNGKPAESTFITSIPLLTLHQQNWKSSQCYKKMQRILWIPIEGDSSIPYVQRRIGQGFLWSPNAAQEKVLAADWNEIASRISTGQLESLDATVGEYLQVRPKAAHGRSLCYGFDQEGNKVQTLPRGFYLRSLFTSTLLSQMGSDSMMSLGLNEEQSDEILSELFYQDI